MIATVLNDSDLLAEVTATEQRVHAMEIAVDWRAPFSVRGGMHDSRSRGLTGTDIAGVKEYVTGDPVRNINYKLSARIPGDNLYLLLRDTTLTIDIYIVVDANASMKFGTVRVLKYQLAAEVFASIFRSAAETMDPVGTIIYRGDGVIEESQPGSLSSMDALFGMLSANRQRGCSTHNSGLAAALDCLPQKRSMVFVLSDFARLSDVDRERLKGAAAIHDLICSVIQDRRERELPGGFGILRLADMNTGSEQTLFLNPLTRKLYANNFAAFQSKLLAFFEEIGCRWQIFSTEDSLEEQVSKTITMLT